MQSETKTKKITVKLDICLYEERNKTLKVVIGNIDAKISNIQHIKQFYLLYKTIETLKR